MRLRAFLALLAALFAFGGFGVSASAQSRVNLTGEWRGVYYGGGGPTTEFEAELTQTGRSLTGTIIERPGSPEAGHHWLLSRLSGSIAGGEVTFTKTYIESAAGWTHTVNYSGAVSDGGRRIRGAWRVGASQGQFEMVR